MVNAQSEDFIKSVEEYEKEIKERKEKARKFYDPKLNAVNRALVGKGVAATGDAYTYPDDEDF